MGEIKDRLERLEERLGVKKKKAPDKIILIHRTFGEKELLEKKESP